MILVFLGYMASGKSTVGKHVAEILNYSFIDLDFYIEEKEKMKVKDIFETKGEIYFRKIEHTYLKDIINEQKNCVLSLGGGTPCFYDSVDWLNTINNVITIYLKASIDVITTRLVNDTIRPLISHLKSKEEIKEFIAKHLFERSFFYNKAQIKLNTTDLSIEEISEKILLELF
ncbi:MULTISPECIES: shikimate kinase [Mesoflavibacter]|uniref:shikimate kinase n=1 Tax=Mesoflavibacter TaxID=444051 RepID=UPI000D0FFC93|nr:MULTISPECIES: shikimate kinase [Mesoflavibacter]QIJ89819.1 Shikimate kinase I [Mesoflavibacter sp. HG96]QIJ92547.1 Shikimate kinase I [Mesoflavibacter sp. HG37]